MGAFSTFKSNVSPLVSVNPSLEWLAEVCVRLQGGPRRNTPELFWINGEAIELLFPTIALVLSAVKAIEQ